MMSYKNECSSRVGQRLEFQRYYLLACNISMLLKLPCRDLSGPQSFNSRDVDERMRSRRDWLLNAEHRHLIWWWRLLDLAESRCCGKGYLPVLQQLLI